MPALSDHVKGYGHAFEHGRTALSDIVPEPGVVRHSDFLLGIKWFHITSHDVDDDGNSNQEDKSCDHGSSPCACVVHRSTTRQGVQEKVLAPYCKKVLCLTFSVN